MIPWSLLSAFALVIASFPSAFFAVLILKRRPAYARLSGLLASAILVHGVYHAVAAFQGESDLAKAAEAASAVLFLLFVLVYRHGRVTPR